MRRTARVLVIVAVSVGIGGRTLSAQTFAAPIGPALYTPSLESGAGSGSQFRKRLVPAAVVGLSAAVTLGFAGYLIVGGCTTKCDVLEWDEVIVGVLVGEVFGSAYGASAHRGRGLCTRVERFGMALGGAFIGALAGVAVAQIPYGRIGVLATVPLGSVMFLGDC